MLKWLQLRKNNADIGNFPTFIFSVPLNKIPRKSFIYGAVGEDERRKEAVTPQSRGQDLQISHILLCVWYILNKKVGGMVFTSSETLTIKYISFYAFVLSFIIRDCCTKECRSFNYSFSTAAGELCNNVLMKYKALSLYNYQSQIMIYKTTGTHPNLLTRSEI